MNFRPLNESDNLKSLQEKGVLEEMCYCGHLQSQHAEEGHESCSLCDCKKYTWSKFGVRESPWKHYRKIRTKK
jgi:hypothetical protein